MGASSSANLQVWDYVIICIHFFLVFSVGIWAAWGGGKDTSGYFLAGRDMSWWLVGLSLYVTNIGSSTFIGVAGTASVSGYAVISYEYYALMALLVLAFVFVPVYFSSDVSTVPEYLKVRFGGDRLQTFISVINLIVAVLIMLSGEMYAGSIVINQALGWNIYTSVILLLALTAIYTVAGGLKAVIFTDALQAVVVIIGAFILMGLAIAEIGGIGNLRLKYMTAIPNTTQIWANTSCGIPQEETWHIFRDAQKSDLPWPGVVFGVFVLGLYFWCTNQVIVQRTLAAKNVTHAKAGCIMTGYGKVLPMFLMVWPGMISRTLFPDEVACVDPDICMAVCDNPAGCSDIAYPKLVIELMPTGLKGLMLAAMLAAMISTLSSIFNASSSMFVIDIWYKLRPSSTELELVIVGKLCTIVLVGIGVLWLPVIQSFGGGELFVYLQSVLSYFSPSVFACFTMAIAWPRVNEFGAFWGMFCGFIVGLTRSILDFVYGIPSCGQVDDRPNIVKNFHFLHFAAFLYAFSLILIGIFSLMTEPIPAPKLVRLTWWTRHSKLPRQAMSEEQEDKDKRNEILKEERTIKETETASTRVGLKWKLLNVVCGVPVAPDESDSDDNNDQEELDKVSHVTDAEEDPWHSTIAAVNGVVLAGVCVFLFGFFA